MPSISQSLIVNVEASYIETYFRTENLVRTGEESGQELKYWIDDLLEAGKINLEKFEDFLFNELFWGKRKTIQVYKLESIKDYKYSSDWHEALKDKYGIDTLKYSDILNCVPNRENPRKIAAVYVEENYRGELEKLRLLFACYIQIAGKDGVTDSISYIPVEIDFVKKIMVIKAWARQQIAYEDHKPGRLMSHIKNLMVLEFGVETRRYVLEHQKVLFEMSKNLIDRAYSCIPPYNELGKINAVVEHFKEEILKKLPLRNVSCDETGRTVLKEGVMNFEDEIKNVVESLTISDYFFDRDYDEIWKMGLEAVVSRIKFNDDERILTSLSGENTSAPILQWTEVGEI